jgi:hypothetical protein
MFGLAAEAVAAYRPQGVDPLITRALNDLFVLSGALSALLTAWARNATQAGNPSLTERIRGAVTGAATGARVGAREGRPS